MKKLPLILALVGLAAAAVVAFIDDDAVAEPDRDHLGAIARAALAAAAGEVTLDRERRQAQVLTDLAVRVPLGHPLQDLDLPSRHGIDALIPRAGTRKREAGRAS